MLLRGNLLTLKHVGVGALLGAHLEIAGTVDQFGSFPRLDLTWRGVLPDAAIPGLNAFVLYFALPCLLFRFGMNTPVLQLLKSKLNSTLY